MMDISILTLMKDSYITQSTRHFYLFNPFHSDRFPHAYVDRIMELPILYFKYFCILYFKGSKVEMPHYIFTACQSTCFQVSRMKRVI